MLIFLVALGSIVLPKNAEAFGCIGCPAVTTPRVNLLVAPTPLVFSGTNSFDASGKSAVSLVRTPQTFSVFDLGQPGTTTEMKTALSSLRVSQACMDYAISSHEHPDHNAQASEFIYGAKHVSSSQIYKGNGVCQHSLAGQPAGTSRKLDTNTWLVSTPGGDTTSAVSMVINGAQVYDTAGILFYTGKVALVGDLLVQSDFTGSSWNYKNFWSSLKSADSTNYLNSIASLICSTNGHNVGWIIPGHSNGGNGRGFAVTSAMRNAVAGRCKFPPSAAPIAVSGCNGAGQPALAFGALSPVGFCPVISSTVPACTARCVSQPRIDVLVPSSGFTVTSFSPFDAYGDATAHLVRTPQTVTMFDLGWPAARTALNSRLNSFGVSRACIDYAVQSHSHADHVGTVSDFQSSVHINSVTIAEGISFCQHSLSTQAAGSYAKLDDYMTLVKTPGDTTDGISTVVSDAEVYSSLGIRNYKGTVAMSGDLIQSSRDFDGTNWGTTGAEPDAATKLRSIAALICDSGAGAGWILPGHGPGFAVTSSMKTAVSAYCPVVSQPGFLKPLDCSAIPSLDILGVPRPNSKCPTGGVNNDLNLCTMKELMLAKGTDHFYACEPLANYLVQSSRTNDTLTGKNIYKISEYYNNQVQPNIKRPTFLTEKSCNLGTVDLLPIYQLYLPARPNHFLTTNTSEIQVAQFFGYRNEGIIGFCAPTLGDCGARIPLMRMYNPKNTDHYYTTDFAVYNNNPGFNKEDPAMCYVWS